jgi:hypothetical protein
MNKTGAFWPAFSVGLSASTTIYDPPPPYWAYIDGYTVAQTFALVGSTLSSTTTIGYGRQPSKSESDTAAPSTAGSDAAAGADSPAA